MRTYLFLHVFQGHQPCLPITQYLKMFITRSMFLAATSPKSKVLVLSKRKFWSRCCYNGAILWADFWYTRMLMSQGKKPYYFHFYTWNKGDPTQFRVHLTFSKWAEPDESIKLHFHMTSFLKIIVSDHTMVTISKDVRLCLENRRHQ